MEPCRWWISAWRAWTTSYPVLCVCLLKVLHEALMSSTETKTHLVGVILQAEKRDKNLLKEHKRDSGLSEAQEKGVAF